MAIGTSLPQVPPESRAVLNPPRFFAI